MKLIPVESSGIRRVGYDKSRRVLRVEFRDGDLYDYLKVPPRVFEQMMATSKGTFLNTVIKPRYAFVHPKARSTR